MAESMMGIETEYGFALIDKRGKQIDRGRAAHWLLETAREILPGLPSGDCYKGAQSYWPASYSSAPPYNSYQPDDTDQE